MFFQGKTTEREVAEQKRKNSLILWENLRKTVKITLFLLDYPMPFVVQYPTSRIAKVLNLPIGNALPNGDIIEEVPTCTQ